MSTVRMEWHEAAYRHVFQSVDGPVGQDLERRCRSLEVYAMSHAGFDTGALVAAIDSVIFTSTGGDLEARVGANPAGEEVGYAYFHHQGTKEHPIFPVRAKMLRFPDRRSGKSGFVFRHSVQHPGTAPNPYLTQHLGKVFP